MDFLIGGSSVNTKISPACYCTACYGCLGTCQGGCQGCTGACKGSK